MTGADVWMIAVLFCLAAYILLDGYDLGIGVLTFLEPDDTKKRQMSGLVATAWDGSESWLVLLGVSLYGGVPGAYSTVLPALYVPLILMLFSLIARGVAIEFQEQYDGWNRTWGRVFGTGSLLAGFCQGAVLGGLLHGITLHGRHFAGGPFDFLTDGYALLTGVTTVVLYVLAGAAWLQLKSEGELRRWAAARGRIAAAALLVLAVACAAVLPAVSRAHLPIGTPYRLVFVILGTGLAALSLALLTRGFGRRPDWLPFAGVAGVYAGGLGAVVALLYPQIVPGGLTVHQAASPTSSVNFLLLGVGLSIPMVIAYNAFAYYEFRGKFSLPENADRPVLNRIASS